MIKIKQGLTIPISGAPVQAIQSGPSVSKVAVIGDDFVGLKPTMRVEVGDKVQRGQALFCDKKKPAVQFVAPAGGEVIAINRGARRVLQSVVIAIDPELDSQQYQQFPQYSPDALVSLSAKEVTDNLLRSGLWVAFRTRPFSQVPEPESNPDAIFINLMDTNPLSANPNVVIADAKFDLIHGIKAIANLTKKPVYLCKSPELSIESDFQENVTCVDFSGPHPAGLTGTHIHFLEPVNQNKVVWSINYQDVIATGQLFTTGKLPIERVIALAGPEINNPRLLKTRLGACVSELVQEDVANTTEKKSLRFVSGSVLSGRISQDVFDFLGRFHLQISVIAEGDKRQFLGYLSPGFNKHSVMNVFFTKLMPNKTLNLTSTTNGSPRSMVSIGAYESVMPLDILPTQLLRALITGDTEMAQKLGCLELDEEDLALCTYVCPGKYEYGPILRDNLVQIEKEG